MKYATNLVRRLLFIVNRMFLFSLTLCNTYLSYRLSVQMTSILFQPHISKFFQVFLIYFPKFPRFSTIQSPAPSVALLTSLFLKFKVGYVGESNLLHMEYCFCHGNPGFNLTCSSCIFYYHATQIVEILHILQLFLI